VSSFLEKRREGWAEGVESWTLSTVFCSNSWCLRVKTPHTSFSPTPRIAYCLRTNGRPMQKPIKCLTHFFLEVSRKVCMPADTCVAPNESSSGCVNCFNQNIYIWLWGATFQHIKNMYRA
jgi:hypothetical protein